MDRILSAQEVRIIYRLFKKGVADVELASRYETTARVIRLILRRHRRHLALVRAHD